MVNWFRDSFHWKTLFFPDSLQHWLARQLQSHQHDRACYTQSLTCTPAFILSALPSPSLTLCPPPLSGLALHNLLGRKVRKCRQEGEKKEKSFGSLEVSLLSVSLSLSHSLTSAWRFAPVSGMSWPCLRGVPAPSAKPIDPLITSCCTSFRKSLYMYNLNTHTSAERKLWCRTYVESVPRLKPICLHERLLSKQHKHCSHPVRLFLQRRAHPLSPFSICIQVNHDISKLNALAVWVYDIMCVYKPYMCV